MDQPIVIAQHDRLIKTATIAAEREINTDYAKKYRDAINNVQPNSKTSIFSGLYATVTDGKIYFEREGTEELHFQSLVRERAMQLLVGQGQTLKQAVLKMLWEFHRDQMLSYRGENGEEYNPEDLPQYVNTHFAYLDEGDNSAYTEQMVFIVLRVLQPVYARQLQNRPFVTPDGEVITAELLVDNPKTLTKLRDMSFAFEEATPEEQTELLTAAVNGKLKDIKAIKTKMRGGPGPITGIWIVHSKGDLYSVEMHDLNEDQLRYIEKALGKGWTQELR